MSRCQYILLTAIALINGLNTFGQKLLLDGVPGDSRGASVTASARWITAGNRFPAGNGCPPKFFGGINVSSTQESGGAMLPVFPGSCVYAKGVFPMPSLSFA
jgi:hypothetical protein